MDTSDYVPDKTDAWQKLERRARNRPVDIRHEFELDKERSQIFSVRTNELFLDYSKNLIDRKIWADLIALADNSPLQKMKDSMFSGEKNKHLGESRCAPYSLKKKSK